jgi:hypothetical protein
VRHRGVDLQAEPGTLRGMLAKALHRTGVRSRHPKLTSLGSIALRVAPWVRNTLKPHE